MISFSAPLLLVCTAKEGTATRLFFKSSAGKSAQTIVAKDPGRIASTALAKNLEAKLIFVPMIGWRLDLQN
ncbi:MAG: hypothetical protein ACO3XI_08190, partial [bacterium]